MQPRQIVFQNGKLTSLQLYHTYADQAGYYDICLLIYHSADYRNGADIRSTWTNLVMQIHQDAIRDDHQAPWELIMLKCQDIARRVALNENIFPVVTLLRMLLAYDIEYCTHDPARVGQQGENGESLVGAPLTWALDVFIGVNAPFESLVSTLEGLWYSEEYPFTGRQRKLIVKWIIYTVEQWEESSRRTGVLFGGENNALGLADLLRVVLGGNELDRGREEDRMWVERGREIRAKIEDAVR